MDFTVPSIAFSFDGKPEAKGTKITVKFEKDAMSFEKNGQAMGKPFKLKKIKFFKMEIGSENMILQSDGLKFIFKSDDEINKAISDALNGSQTLKKPPTGGSKSSHSSISGREVIDQNVHPNRMDSNRNSLPPNRAANMRNPSNPNTKPEPMGSSYTTADWIPSTNQSAYKPHHIPGTKSVTVSRVSPSVHSRLSTSPIVRNGSNTNSSSYKDNTSVLASAKSNSTGDNPSPNPNSRDNNNSMIKKKPQLDFHTKASSAIPDQPKITGLPIKGTSSRSKNNDSLQWLSNPSTTKLNENENKSKKDFSYVEKNMVTYGKLNGSTNGNTYGSTHDSGKYNRVTGKPVDITLRPVGSINSFFKPTTIPSYRSSYSDSLRNEEKNARQLAQAIAESLATSTHEAYDPFRFDGNSGKDLTAKRGKFEGLRNLGNTCYLSSICHVRITPDPNSNPNPNSNLNPNPNPTPALILTPTQTLTLTLIRPSCLSDLFAATFYLPFG
jgi:hypothetical protein